MKKKVIAVVGPTAVGKTKCSVEIAKRYGEVISGDSMQIYKGMDVGTAKVTEEEMQGIRHHMIDIKEPDETFSVAEFKREVVKHIENIHKEGRIPIIAGGTGLYIQSVLYDYDFAEEKRDHLYQEALEAAIERDGIDIHYARLERIDPDYAAKVHKNNTRRVIRALEVYDKTGLTMTEYAEQETERESPYEPILIGLYMEREQLYDRINRRVDAMMEEGLLDEVRELINLGYENAQSMQAIGYKEFVPYFQGESTLDEAVSLLKRNTRRFAKRQLTWFRNKLDVRWYEMDEASPEQTFSTILQDLEGIIEGGDE
ncbi:tRNA delta(2)-isopentenylpyrophosphate transferase [Pontibacillus halophilus JSM 076056 = DSM 19796]|uniref:tRNA dimethylallyltransferase n=1 Tax=Pontibacillus halophilus JSM 076056 = DSM 19796 TaxID=1385510 RepID=A0A0A5GPC4_9BACI|nr:tRNA (adenosine(37)-N6)-dimethylallyltransferase MiaA [Pontibacillus halophilus]KGX93088.1 tRNA delta(2)-isopentenylpyrophosphate transferase [Pontibacillus halophilus JSM 076056 = DSM 19796]